MSLFLLCVIFVLSSCEKQDRNVPAANTSPPEAPSLVTRQFSYLALGDSYTIGQGVNGESSFPLLLSKSLKTDTHKWVAKPITIVARTGWTTGDLIDGIKLRSIPGKYDIVTLLIGVNNQFRGYPAAEYRQEFAELLSTALYFANGDKNKVFVLSIPDWGVTPYANGYDKAQVANEIDLFNSINKEEAQKAGINYTDITGISRMAGTDISLLATDRLHPSERMYQLWVDQLSPKVLQQLSKSN